MTNQSAIDALVELLEGMADATGAPLFGLVVGNRPDVAYVEQATYHRADVAPLSWTTDPKLVPGRIAVVLSFEVILTTALSNTPLEEPEGTIDQLVEQVTAEVNGADLGDTCVATQTRITDGRYFQYGKKARILTPSPTRNERRVWLYGSITWLRD